MSDVMASSIGRVAATAAQQIQRANPLGDRGARVAQERSAELTGAFLRGENVEMHQVMAASEEAGISLEMMVEVRNKFAEAYRTLINMQS